MGGEGPAWHLALSDHSVSGPQLLCVGDTPWEEGGRPGPLGAPLASCLNPDKDWAEMRAEGEGPTGGLGLTLSPSLWWKQTLSLQNTALKQVAPQGADQGQEEAAPFLPSGLLRMAQRRNLPPAPSPLRIWVPLIKPQEGRWQQERLIGWAWCGLISLCLCSWGVWGVSCECAHASNCRVTHPQAL